jgi:site-specific recombinase XerD
MKPPRQTLEQIFDDHLCVLATILRPGTVKHYRSDAHRFLTYLHAAFPQVRKLGQLRRDPHVLGWLRFLCEQDPPLRNSVRGLYLIRLRRLFHDLADNGHALPPDLIRREDFPPPDHYLPKPLSPEDDQLLDQQLRHTDDLLSNVLLLIRATGVRIGEAIDLPLDCLRQVSATQWALHVPLGKLYTERWVPVHDDTRRIVARILQLRALAPPQRLLHSQDFLLPRYREHDRWYVVLRRTLAEVARCAGCAGPVTPHRLRHSFASEMLRLGVSLPALMQLLGHKDIHMTLRYVQVTQQDLQREFHLARLNTASLHSIPKLPLPATTAPVQADIAAIRNAITATRHLLQLFRPQLHDDKSRRKLRRLSQRLLNLGHELDSFADAEK